MQPRKITNVGLYEMISVEPIGLTMVAGALSEEGYPVYLEDFVNTQNVQRYIEQYKPDICGLSCSFTSDQGMVKEIARKIKAHASHTLVFIGGHHASMYPQGLADDSIDAVVLGEGEITVKELVQAYKENEDLSRVPGLFLNHQDQGWMYTGTRPLIQNLDNLPFPRRDLLTKYKDKYFIGLKKSVFTLETGRGCPHKCKFCSVWKFFHKKYRMKSPERVVEEIKKIPGDAILITDDNFFSNYERAEKIGKMLESEGIKKYFNVQARSDDVVKHPELIRLWRRLGLSSVFIGFEQIDEAGLEKLGKNNSVINNEKAHNLLRELGVRVISSFIVDPGYTRGDFQAMIDYIKKKSIDTPAFSVLTPLPGTELYRELKQDLQVQNFDLYDLLHAVLPTTLSLETFYQEFANLWKAVYKKQKMKEISWEAVKEFITKPEMWVHSVKLLSKINALYKVENYLKDHWRIGDHRIMQ